GGSEGQSGTTRFPPLALLVLAAVDRLLGNARGARASTDVDRDRRAGRRPIGSHLAEGDTTLEHGRMRAGRHLAALPAGHAVARDGPLFHHERGQPAFGAPLLDRTKLPHSCEVLVERTYPAERGGDRVRLRRNVVAVERVAHLESKRVARAETAGMHAAGHH